MSYRFDFKIWWVIAMVLCYDELYIMLRCDALLQVFERIQIFNIRLITNSSSHLLWRRLFSIVNTCKCSTFCVNTAWTEFQITNVCTTQIFKNYQNSLCWNFHLLSQNFCNYFYRNKSVNCPLFCRSKAHIYNSRNLLCSG